MTDPNPELDPDTQRFFSCVLMILGSACIALLCVIAYFGYELVTQ